MFIQFLLSLCLVLDFHSHTYTFNVLIPVGLHRLMMQTQVIRISIQHLVDPVEHSESVVKLRRELPLWQ
ncbi:hypothetical protein MTR67_013160 [Solanum verrucosum]|uniref:Uncharacterized protein n=1 Tax=Solanum verrucosum TaxID=315347 RepID=A0AAF0QCM5_SOLVR|nr:hypothetical protein MTR67_013160 [Solanum verrucosum]